ncbi:hypothetical protein Mal15_01660 [Stieleria maiorica]|uniref:Uncharacterized protein n=1 Tax=Stieleria maiorica TaxID=2795974 RepID=A0A5B9M7X0_9BACT|nr:hypothetical protein [Stieleria maiorica]QEF96140.1 hypothetical protein Mal15_01660 [Stieleria maiorica]
MKISLAFSGGGVRATVLFHHGDDVADATLSTYGNEALRPVPSNRVLFRAA